MLSGYRFSVAAVPGFKLSIFPAESLNTSGRIYQFLFARKKGMTLGANFNPDIFFGRPYLNHITARTPNRGLKILWMYVLLHVRPPDRHSLFENYFRKAGNGCP